MWWWIAAAGAWVVVHSMALTMMMVA